MQHFNFNYEIDREEYKNFITEFDTKFQEGEFDKCFKSTQSELHTLIEEKRDFHVDFFMSDDSHKGYVGVIEHYYKDEKYRLKFIYDDMDKLREYHVNLKLFLNKFNTISVDEMREFLENFIKKCVTKNKSLFIVRIFYNAYLINQMLNDKLKA